jgi:internalin A
MCWRLFSLFSILVTLSLVRCGAAKTVSDVMVYGGEPVATGEYRDVVALTRLQADGTYKIFCSGVLISPRHVLTAGHCVSKAKAATLASLNIYFGEGVEGGTIIGEQLLGLHPVTRTAVHPRLYKDPNGHADIGVLTLQGPVTTVKPVSILQDFAAERAAKNLTLVGFGQRQDRGTGLKFQANVRIRAPRFNAHEMVAGGEGQDACYGDSGGGVFTETQTPQSQRQLYALISRGSRVGCGSGGYVSLVAEHVCWLEREAQVSPGSFGCLKAPLIASSEDLAEQKFFKSCENQLQLPKALRRTVTAVLLNFGMPLPKTKAEAITVCHSVERRLRHFNTMIKTLDLSQFRLLDLRVLADQKQLVSLNLEGNQLKNIDALLSLPKLKQLWIRGNDLENSTALSILQARGVQIFGLRSQLGNYLETEFNKVCEHTAMQDPVVKAILYVTQTSDCTAANLHLLGTRSLDLSGFQISDLAALVGLDGVTTLDLSNNPLQDISRLSSLESLKSLNLTNTAVQDFSPLLDLERRGLVITSDLDH